MRASDPRQLRPARRRIVLALPSGRLALTPAVSRPGSDEYRTTHASCSAARTEPAICRQGTSNSARRCSPAAAWVRLSRRDCYRSRKMMRAHRFAIGPPAGREGALRRTGYSQGNGYGTAAASFFASSSVKARSVSVRTLPRPPAASASVATVSSSRASLTTTASY